MRLPRVENSISWNAVVTLLLLALSGAGLYTAMQVDIGSLRGDIRETQNGVREAQDGVARNTVSVNENRAQIAAARNGVQDTARALARVEERLIAQSETSARIERNQEDLVRWLRSVFDGGRPPL